MSIFNNYLKENILKQSGLLAWWPLDDPSPQPYARVLTPGLSVGRNLVLNATPSSATSWTLNANWAYASNLFTHTAGSTATISQAMSQSLTSGRAYSVTYIVSGMTTGTITVSLTASGTTRSANGTYTETIVITGTTLTFTPSSTFDGSISGFSVTELNIPPIGCSYSNPTLIADGDMEAVGTASWTAGNSATLSKQTGTPYAGTQCLRVARNGVNIPYAKQTILIIGTVYHVWGYARSDGSATPVIYTNGTGTTLYTGSTTAQWFEFNFVFVATATDINFGSSTVTGTQYVEYDGITVVPDTSLQLGELAQDGDMELAGVVYWGASQATITKQTVSPHSGTNCLRVTATASAGARAPQAFQGGLNAVKSGPCVLGKTYRVQGWCRSDGTQIPKISITGAFVTVGTASTSWQFFDIVGIDSATLIVFGFQITGPVGTEYTEWDDISITEVHPMVGLPTNGVVQQSPPWGICSARIRLMAQMTL
jgi:hypothetical protein